MKSLFSTLVLCSTWFFGHAQITVIKDARIDELVRNQSAIIPPSTVPQMNGYRVQITHDSDKSTVDDARSKFIAQFPKVDTYVEFTAPHYYLKVGDFRTLLEAERVKAAIQQQFPTCFIAKERINLPRIDQ
ncbi:MAG: SPOR domain-containing protein [Fluviicola sp.]|nr:SPOR domain-containing protein [Fluviicola sp.]